MREIHIEGQTWQWQVGTKNVVIKEPPKSGELFPTKHVIDLSTFTGLSWYALERMDWKNSGVQITPQDVKDYILKHYEVPAN